MKLKYLFSIILSSVLLFAGCTKDEPTGSYDNIKLDKTYLSIPENGGSVTVKLTATESWAFVVTNDWPEVVKTDKDGNETSRTPSWLSAASKMSGEAGEYDITFSAESVAGGREIELAVKAGSNTQILRVRQGSLEASSATCAEIIAGPDGKTYRTKGTCTAIANTTYGNWYLNDGTGEIYIYGTLDAKGAEKNFTSLGLEVGDVVEVEGPKTTYGSTIELVNVTVIKITKSLAKVLTESKTYPIDGGEFGVKVAYKGSNFSPSVPEEYRDWASVVDVKTIAGVPSKIETNPAYTAVVTVKLFPNAGGDRKGQIDFTSGSSKVYYEFVQEGAIIETAIDNILAAEDGDTQYRVTGYVSKVDDLASGKIYIKDATGELYLYKVSYGDFTVKAGDIITVVGKKGSYKGAPQLVSAVVESRIEVRDIDLAGFRALPDNKEAWYRISGKVAKSTEANTKFDLEGYGNFALTDGTTEVYVYGVKTGWGGAKGQFGTLGVKEGDNLTIVCYKTSYNGLIEADGCFYVSHESGSENPGGGDTAGGKYVKVTSAQTDWTGKYLIVFDSSAHATLESGTKDLKATVSLTIVNDAVEATSEVNAAALTVAKNGDKYVMTFSNGKYFGMQHNGCLLSDNAFDLDFEYTAAGVKVSGYVASKSNTYYLYHNTNNGSYFRCYLDKSGDESYFLPSLFKYVE